MHQKNQSGARGMKTTAFHKNIRGIGVLWFQIPRQPRCRLENSFCSTVNFETLPLS